MPSDMLIFLNRTNNTEIKNQLDNLINSGLTDLKKEIKKMSKAEIKNEKPDKIVNIVERFLSSMNKINKEKV